MLRVPSRAFRLLPTSLPAGLTFDVAENKQQQLEAVEKLNEVVDWATNGGSDKAKGLVELDTVGFKNFRCLLKTFEISEIHDFYPGVKTFEVSNSKSK